MKTMNKSPIAVLISDVHYSIHTLELADAAMRMAIKHANDLEVPLIVAGDLHDTKANLRAECVNAMIDTFKTAKLQPYVLRGNHDQINEKSEEHALNFLQDLAFIVEKPRRFAVELDSGTFDLGFLVPYQHDKTFLRSFLTKVPKSVRIIMHQGIQGSNSGDYFQDNSALSPEDVAGLRVISGHYHARQTISLPQGGVWDYIGNPYTLNYGEANDPEKGYQVLYSDGSLGFVPTKLRKHVVIELDAKFEVLNEVCLPRLNDLIQVRVYGTKEELSKVTRETVTEWLTVPPTKLELIPTQADQPVVAKKANGELLDELIEGLDASSERKASLKELWRKLVS